jgi:DNA mismatch repair protein PMS2
MPTSNIQFDKKNFAALKILGHFNKGFIVTFDREQREIFIIDQHASDEKTNYEKLLRQNTYSQKLMKSICLQFSPFAVEIIEQNRPIFVQNGFHYTVEEIEGQRCIVLNSLPAQNYGIEFTYEDFIDIYHSIDDESGGGVSETAFRPKKILKMLATKACRMSIKVGDSLTSSKWGIFCTI